MPATATAEAGQSQSWKRGTTRQEVRFQLPIHWPRSDEDSKGKGKGKNGRQAPEAPLQLATRAEGDEAEDGYRAWRTTQRSSPLRIRSLRHRQHPRRWSSRRKQNWRRVWWTRATAVAAHAACDGGNSSIWQEPGRPGSPAPKALGSGRTYRPKRRLRDSTETSTSGSYHSNQEETSQHCESKTLPAETWGAETRKTERFSIVMLTEEWRPSPPEERKSGLKKEERHGRDDSAYGQARREPVPSHNLQENSQARVLQLDTTTARRNQPVKRRRVLQQAPRGRGMRRPAQGRSNLTPRKV